MTFPSTSRTNQTVTMNGDTHKTLIDQNMKVRSAALALAYELRQAAPHGRNYPNGGDAMAVDKAMYDSLMSETMRIADYAYNSAIAIQKDKEASQ